MKTDLCSLCNGTCAQNSTEAYYNYEGAFRCMADGDNDRVGFVRQTTAMEFLAKYSSYGTLEDYKLLCPDGTTAGKFWKISSPSTFKSKESRFSNKGKNSTRLQ